MSHACIFTSLCIAMATIVLIMESQNSKLYIRWGSIFPVDRTLISRWKKALYLGFPYSPDFILCFSRQLFVFSVRTWRGCSQLEDSGMEGDEVTLLSQGQPGTVLVWVLVLSLKDCSRLPSKPLEICRFGKGWCEVMSNNRP